MKPELFIKAQEMLKRAGAAGERLTQGMLDAPDPAAKRRRVALLGGAGIVAVSIALYTMTHIGGQSPLAEPVDARQAVTVITAGVHEFSPRIDIIGEARPKRDIHVYSPTSGVRVLELLADEGDMVRAGQPLARLDAAVSNAQIRSAQASVAEAESAALRARDEYNRAESIRESGALSAEAIGQRRAAAAAADARLSAARAQLQETNARLQGGYVRAPLSGLVIARSVQLGALVDQQEMFRIAGGNALEVAANVAEADVLALREGQTATFVLVDGSTVTARMSRGPASINSQTRTGEALFDLPLNTRVRAGMYLRGEVRLSSQAALALPQSSVLFDQNATYVFLVGDDNRVRKSPVLTGQRDGDMIEILSGIDAGARIVGAGAAFLQDGDPVRAVMAQAPVVAAPVAADPANLRGRAE